MQAPCKDCPDRKYMCHSTCEKYIAYDKYRKEIREKRMEYNTLARDAWVQRKKKK